MQENLVSIIIILYSEFTSPEKESPEFVPTKGPVT